MPAIAQALPPDVQSAVEGIAAFARAEILPLHAAHKNLLENPRAAWREDGRHADEVVALIRQIRMRSAAAGFFTMCVPESLGGAGLGHLAYFAAWERLFHLCGPQNWLMLYALSHWAFGPSRLLEHITEEARARILAPMMRGETSMCFGLSEPGAGSDAAAITTRARPDAAGWRITGRKIWTTNAPLADHCILFAVTEPARAAARRGGISAFLLPTNAPGFTVQRVIRFFGHLGGDEAELVLEDVEAESWQLVGREGAGFEAALYGINLGRIYNTARAVGTARWALEMAFAHANLRTAFGAKLSDHQGVSFPLAESATEIHAAHLMGLNAATLLDEGHPTIKEVAMAKCYAVQAGARAVDRAMQAHGAMGFTNELGLTDAWHNLRQINVADGTNEILTRTVVQRMSKGDTEL
jgi:alkylation response protein AidB-like acyl-CoA dehydrogenase